MILRSHQSPVVLYHEPHAMSSRLGFVALDSTFRVQAIRMNSGAGAGTLETPHKVTDYTPAADDVGGLWDNHARAATARAKRG